MLTESLLLAYDSLTIPETGGLPGVADDFPSLDGASSVPYSSGSDRREGAIKAATSKIAWRAATAAALAEIKGDREWQDLAVELQVHQTTLSKLINGVNTASTELSLQFNDIHPGYLTILFRNFARIQSEGKTLSGRTTAARRAKEQITS